jgi:hypothetical protein
METDERISSLEPAGVMATACTHRRPEATREATAVIAARINWQLARDRPGLRINGNARHRAKTGPLQGQTV